MTGLVPGGTTLGSIVSTGVGAVVSTALHDVGAWMLLGASQLVDGALSALDATTAVPTSAGFDAVFAVLRQLGAELVAVFLGLAVIRAILRQDLGELARVVGLRLPLALIGSGAVVEAVGLLLGATDELSADVLRAGGGAASSYASSFATSLASSGSLARSGFELLVAALAAALVALVLWCELVVRAASISVALLFVPLALAGAVFPATLSWARRLAELIVSLVCSKLVIAGVVALAVAELGTPSGVAGLVQAVALLLLACFVPFVLWRLVPAVEAGVVAQLDDVGARARRAIPSLVGLGEDAAAMLGPDFVPTPRPELPWAGGMDVEAAPGFDALVAELADGFRLPEDDAGGEGER